MNKYIFKWYLLIVCLPLVNCYGQNNPVFCGFDKAFRSGLIVNTKGKKKIKDRKEIPKDEIGFDIANQEMVLFEIYNLLENHYYEFELDLQISSSPGDIGFGIYDCSRYSYDFSTCYHSEVDNGDTIVRIRTRIYNTYKRAKYFGIRNLNVIGESIKVDLKSVVITDCTDKLAERGKNFVFNGGFEIYNRCPALEFDGLSELHGWNNAITNYDCIDSRTELVSPDILITAHKEEMRLLRLGSPDLVTNCIESFSNSVSHLSPKFGNAHATLNLWLPNTESRSMTQGEFLCTKLEDTLRVGGKYAISFWFCFADQFSNFRSNSLGIRLGNCPYSMDDLHFENKYSKPTILANDSALLYKSGWQRFYFEFETEEHYQYLTIGRFHNSHPRIVQNRTGKGRNSSSYYYIDEVSLILLDD